MRDLGLCLLVGLSACDHAHVVASSGPFVVTHVEKEHWFGFFTEEWEELRVDGVPVRPSDGPEGFAECLLEATGSARAALCEYINTTDNTVDILVTARPLKTITLSARDLAARDGPGRYPVDAGASENGLHWLSHDEFIVLPPQRE